MRPNLSFSTLLRDARYTSRSKLGALLDYVAIHPDRHYAALPILYHHLAQDRYSPRHPAKTLRLHVDLATMAIVRLLHFDGDHPDADQIVSSLVAHLPPILHWADFLAMHCILATRLLGDDVETVALDAVLQFYGLGRFDDLRYLIFSHQSLRTLLQIWVLCSRESAYDFGTPNASKIVLAIETIMVESGASEARVYKHRNFWEKPDVVLPDNLNGVAQCAMELLRSLASGSLAEVWAPGARRSLPTMVKKNIAVALALPRLSNLLCHRMLSLQLIRIVSEILELATWDPCDLTDISSVCATGFKFGHLWLTIEHSPHIALWTEQAVEGRIIQSLLKLTLMILKLTSEIELDSAFEPVNVLLKFIGEYLSIAIPKCLIFRFVFHAVQRAVAKVAESGLATDEESLGVVWPSWKVLLSTLRERGSAEPQGAQFRRRCGSTTCTSIDVSLTRCAGCFEVYYCSQACQRQSWKHEGHRALCQLLQKRFREGEAEPTSTEQADYMVAVTINMIRQKRDMIRDQISALPALELPLLIFDFTRAKVRIEVMPYESNGPEELRATWDAPVREARATKQIILQVQYTPEHSAHRIIPRP